ncbi:MAG: hypothetical protein ACRCX2_37745 [Paraclostridium sp.]
MWIKGTRKKINEIAKALILYGFEYSDLERQIEKYLVAETERQLEHFTDLLLDRIEANSNYIKITDTKTNKNYYYMSVKEASEDTGMTLNTINNAIYGTNLANKTYEVEKMQFSSKDITKNKENLFSKKLGKVEIIKSENKTGKYVKAKLKVTDTKTGLCKVYKSGKSFCNEFKFNQYDLSKYILHKYKYKKRWLIEVVK